MINAMGIVNYESHDVSLAGLTEFRTISAANILGRYRIIDFIVSNMVNSGISNIKVMVKNKPRSLIEHLSVGSEFNINQKHGNLSILYGDYQDVNSLYNTDLFLLRQNIEKFEEANEEYVVIAPTYMLSIIDFEKIVKEHEESKADVTVVYKSVNDADKHFINCRCVDIDRHNFVQGFSINRGQEANVNISMEMYVMRRELLVNLLHDQSISPIFTLEDVISELTKNFDVRPYQFKDFLRCITSFDEYYRINMELIDWNVSKVLFNKDWPIYTRTNDSAPTLFSKDAVIKNSVIANGCVIQGHIENSIIGRGVHIHKGTVIKNSIVLPNTFIDENTIIENAIIDKHVKIIKKKEIIGTDGSIAYIRRRDVI